MPKGSLRMKPDQRLRKAERLTKSHQFALMYKEGFSIRAKRLSLLLRPNGLDINRIGISVSKKKAAAASQRNRFKRLVREAYRRNKTHLIKGVDILILPAKVEGDPFYKVIESELLDLMKKASQKTRHCERSEAISVRDCFSPLRGGFASLRSRPFGTPSQ